MIYAVHKIRYNPVEPRAVSDSPKQSELMRFLLSASQQQSTIPNIALFEEQILHYLIVREEQILHYSKYCII